MKLVREHISFKRHIEPKVAMGIGLYEKREFKHHPSCIKFLAQNLLAILKLDKFPDDMFLYTVVKTKEGKHWDMKKEYRDILWDYIFKYVTVDGHPPLFFVHSLGNKLLKMGVPFLTHIEYAKKKKMQESYDFKRGLEPKDAMRTGGAFTDSKGNPLFKGDFVFVNAHMKNTEYYGDFQGVIFDFDEEHVLVEDQDGNVFPVEPDEIEKDI